MALHRRGTFADSDLRQTYLGSRQRNRRPVRLGVELTAAVVNARSDCGRVRQTSPPYIAFRAAGTIALRSEVV